MRPSETDFNEIWIRILSFSFMKLHLKMSSARMAAILSRGRWVNIQHTDTAVSWGVKWLINSLLYGWLAGEICVGKGCHSANYTYGLPDYLLDKLQRVQNAAARLLCGIGKYDHISPTLKSLHWLPVKQRIEFKISVLVYKCLNGLAPQYLCKLLHFYAKDRDLRSADDKTLLEMPQSRTKFGERAFCYYAPKIWNSLPKDMRSSKSIDTFKKKVKTHLFSLAYHGKWLLKLII